MHKYNAFNRLHNAYIQLKKNNNDYGYNNNNHELDKKRTNLEIQTKKTRQNPSGGASIWQNHMQKKVCPSIG